MPLNYYRNIPLLYIYSIFIKRVSMPIVILYFLLNNLNLTQIGILAAVMSIIMVGTEVHGGIFADIHGKRISLMLHSVFGILTMLFYFVGNSFEWFLLASVMYGIAGAFITGTRNALLYDTLIKLNRTSEFKKFNGRVLLYSHLVNALVLLAIPIIYVFNTKLPFLIGAGFFFVSLLTAFFFIEPPMAKRSKATLSLYNIKLLEALKEIKLSNKLLSALILTMLMAAFVYMSSEFIQPLLKISGLQVVYFGIVYALMRAIMGLGGSIAHKLEKYFSLKNILFIGAAGLAISLLGFSFGAGAVIILAILVLMFSTGLNRIVLEDEINRNIKSNNRTTILSISSLSEELFNAGLIFVFGITADLVGVQNMFGYALAFFIICIAVSLIFMRKN